MKRLVTDMFWILQWLTMTALWELGGRSVRCYLCCGADADLPGCSHSCVCSPLQSSVWDTSPDRCWIKRTPSLVPPPLHIRTCVKSDASILNSQPQLTNLYITPVLRENRWKFWTVGWSMKTNAWFQVLFSVPFHCQFNSIINCQLMQLKPAHICHFMSLFITMYLDLFNSAAVILSLNERYVEFHQFPFLFQERIRACDGHHVP